MSITTVMKEGGYRGTIASSELPCNTMKGIANTLPKGKEPTSKVEAQIQIRVTVLARYQSFNEACVSYRFEIRWNSAERWLDLGLRQDSELEWQLMMSLLVLGAKRAGCAFTIEENAS